MAQYFLRAGDLPHKLAFAPSPGAQLQGAEMFWVRESAFDFLQFIDQVFHFVTNSRLRVRLGLRMSKSCPVTW